VEPDARQRRERHGSLGEGVSQLAAVVAREDEPAATGGALEARAAKSRETEGLAVGEAVEGAVREREQWQRRRQGELSRGNINKAYIRSSHQVIKSETLRHINTI
jgi:hypothetical protein